MSLTTFLDQADVRMKFREFFPKPQMDIDKRLLVPAESNKHSLIGTAFDYLLRFHLEYWLAHRSERRWVAFAALQRIADMKDKKLLAVASTALKMAEEFHNNFLTTGNCNHDLLYTCLKLAQFDAIFRAAHVSPRIIMAANTQAEAKELERLIRVVPEEPFHTASTCFLNPTFGDASVLVGGADADLILDDTLIDIKTVKHLGISRDYFNQIIGYYALSRIGRLRGDERFGEIKYLAIYFSRYGYIHKFEIARLWDETHFHGFLEWFVERAKNEMNRLDNS